MHVEEPSLIGFTIYSKSGCSYCVKVKQLLMEKISTPSKSQFTKDELVNIYNNYPDIIFSRDVAFNLLNQSLKFVDFEYKDIYSNNFEILNKHYNLNKFDYTNLLEKII